MGNKNPVTRIVNYPAKFKPLLDQELEDKGFFSYCELMGHILAGHYGINKKNSSNNKAQDTIIKGVKLNDREKSTMPGV